MLDATMKPPEPSQETRGARVRWSMFLQSLCVWLTTWEVYPLLLVGGFLRLYQLNITEFDDDQALVFRMARDAITHGLLPATSNIASIRIDNPPAVIYLLMAPASISANPLGGALLVALLNIVAVLLTYLFVRRYFGRLAAVLAASFYATATLPLHFSRFIWQQNMIAPFVVLFLFALYRGAVDRRKGWLFPALFLLGLLIQLHETTVLLVVPLLLAILLAPETVRWRDLIYGALSLLLIYSTYIMWEIATNFFDVRILLSVSKFPAHIDSTALTYYQDIFSPYSQIPTNPHTFIYQLYPVLFWLRLLMPLLVVSGLVVAATVFLLSFPPRSNTSNAPGETSVPASKLWLRLWQGWTRFRSSPERCGMLLLLTWQIVPLLMLSRHSVPIFPYYVLFLVPGPFILIGLLIERLSGWLRQGGPRWTIPRYCLYIFIAIVLIVQTVGTTAELFDETSGNIRHGTGYNSLTYLENALHEAGQLATRRHLRHIYISSDQYSQTALRYLAEQIHTPTTVFDASNCLVLPGSDNGPAVYLVDPGDLLALALLSRFASVSLIDQPPRLGGDPYQLSIVQPLPPGGVNASNQRFVNNLQLLSANAEIIHAGSATLLATRWTFLRSMPVVYRSTYTYSISATMQASGNTLSNQRSNCVFSSMQAGDQLVVTFPLSSTALSPMQVSFTGRYYITQPHNIAAGPLQLENVRDQRTIPATLQNSSGGNTLILKLP